MSRFSGRINEEDAYEASFIATSFSDLEQKEYRPTYENRDFSLIEDELKRADGLSNLCATFKSPLSVKEAAGSIDEAEAEANFDIMRHFWDARTHFGMSRIRLGAFLYLIKTHRLWRGISENWGSFLAKENVDPNAARQYMTVAKKFVFEMNLPQETLEKLSLAGITALERAAKDMSPENQDEIISMLSELAERDAIQQLMEMSKKDDPVKSKPGFRVLALLKQFSELPPEMQQQFKEKIKFNDKRRALENQSDEVSF